MIRPRPTPWHVGPWRVWRLGDAYIVAAGRQTLRLASGPARPAPRRFETVAAALAAARRMAKETTR
jgi:hypothetical protein